jgi:hypothetical protein
MADLSSSTLSAFSLLSFNIIDPVTSIADPVHLQNGKVGGAMYNERDGDSDNDPDPSSDEEYTSCEENDGDHEGDNDNYEYDDRDHML